MFIGEYNFNLDDSHRLNLPNSFQKNFEESLVISKGFEKCLCIYNASDWEILSNKINELSVTKSINRRFSRALNSGAYETNVDSKGRICIGQKLIEYANLEKECVIIGVSNKIEIWSKKEWYKYQTENENVMTELGEEIDI
ncbi:MAG: division/cell wall cluster transcriptional repressor MraZ, partial [Bacilli bacterium]